jgi:hypothetical protein
MGKILLFIVLTLAVILKNQFAHLISWFARNPTMHTESVGYLIWLLIIVGFVLVGRYYNKIKIL